MENKICLDTDFLINFLRNKEEEVDYVKKNERDKDFGTTYINLFELYHGAYKSNQQKKNLKAISSILDRLNILDFSEESVKLAGKLLAELERKGRPIDFRDLLIGTIALSKNHAIKTNNRKHFDRVAGLSLAD